MDPFTQDDLHQLVQQSASPLLTLCMPTFRAGNEVRQNSIRFKNLLDHAQAKLKDAKLDKKTINHFMNRLRPLLEDEHWWQHQSDALMVFASRDDMNLYRFPLDVTERVQVDDHYYVQPLIQLLQGDGQFYVLAVSQNRVRFLNGTRFGISEVELDELPSDLRSALNIDEYVQSLQQHSAGQPNSPGSMLFHGHGGSNKDVQKKDEISQFFKRIDSALSSYLAGKRTPLVFAGVDYLFPIFRDACHYRGLADTPITGSPDQLKPEELHPKAWAIVEPIFQADRDQAISLFHQAQSKGQAIAQLNDVVSAAREGSVDTLLVAESDFSLEGKGELNLVDQVSTMDVRKKVNDAAIYTLSNSGTVYSVPSAQMPGHQPAAALLRF